MSTHPSKMPNRDNWFNRNPKKATVMFVVGVCLIFVVAAEVLLRLGGDKPGLELPGAVRVERVEDLKIYNSFFTDGEGVFKANKEYNWGDGKYGEGVEINSDGFRSIEFKGYGLNKKKILFLGDSFAWGASAKPIRLNQLLALQS